MARLQGSGFELNSNTDGVEWGDTNGAGASIQGTTKRSGDFAGKILNPATGVRTGWAHRHQNTASEILGRFYLNITTLPDVRTTVWKFTSVLSLGGGGNEEGCIELNTDGTLTLVYDDGGGRTQVGSASSALSTGTWYRIEVRVDGTGAGGSNILQARIDGVQFAGSTTLSLHGFHTHFACGANLMAEACTSGEWYFDDVAVNDTAGTVQNSYPGAGSMIHLYPNAAGDFAEGTGNGFADIDEVTPDDATTFHTLVDPSTGSTDADRLDVNIENFSTKVPGGADSIACYQVGVRVEQEANSFVLRTKRGAAGTLRESATVTIAAAVAWTTHDDTAGTKQYKLTRYVDPEDNASALTSSMMDSIQIGIRAPDATPDLQVTSMWALVDYVPTVGGGGDAVPQVWAQYRRRRVGCI